MGRIPALIPFRKILIANRGEIAVRIIRACRALGISPVAVYSDADRSAPHVRLADQAVHIGPSSPRDSYLRIEKLVEAARRVNADAIHPGYGFLAENAEFAEASDAAGIVFIGPRPDAIRAMGLKVAARERMSAAGIPVVPESGYPLLIKASAGGGGRGMRLVRDASQLTEMMESARREAESAFGDGTLLVERYIERARHIEFQILGDQHGNLVHLFERECSIQRRHQKIIEESPSPALTPDLRARMGAAAVAAGRAINYSNAGTVEFILASSVEFYFIEVNTRIQVEHPVTELVTGLDLIQLQIQIAEGQPLPFRQDQIQTSGHAIEARLYAEDPANAFLPSTGTIRACRLPSDLRVDAAIETGQEIGIYYDPLLAKIASHGPDRETARRRLIAGLRDTVVQGLQTNRDFLIQVLEHEAFRSGDIHTELALSLTPAPADPVLAAIAAVWHAHGPKTTLLPHVPPSYRNNPYRDPSIKLQISGAIIDVSWRRTGDSYAVACGDKKHTIEVIHREPGGIRVAVDGLQTFYPVSVDAGNVYVGSQVIQRVPRYPDPNSIARAETANSPMPGQVLRILVVPGQAVRAGDPLVIVEAMKMEQTIGTTINGIVEEILVQAGQMVAPGQKLVQISAQESPQ